MGMGRAGGAMASVSPWPIRPYRASDGRFIARLAAVTFLLPLPIGITGTWVPHTCFRLQPCAASLTKTRAVALPRAGPASKRKVDNECVG